MTEVKDHGRAGRDLRAAFASAIVLLVAIALSLLFWKTAFMVIVAAAVVVAVWELGRGFAAKGIDLPEQPLMIGGVVMVAVAYFWGAPALVTATAVTALVTMLWLLRRGVEGYVPDATHVDRAKWPKYAPGQSCAGCALYQGAAGSASGPCPIYGGKLVAAKGWCDVFVKKT